MKPLRPGPPKINRAGRHSSLDKGGGAAYIDVTALFRRRYRMDNQNGVDSLADVSELTLDDLAALKDSPVVEELAKIVDQNGDEHSHADSPSFASYV
jgi:hypothetical protein